MNFNNSVFFLIKENSGAESIEAALKKNYGSLSKKDEINEFVLFKALSVGSNKNYKSIYAKK